MARQETRTHEFNKYRTTHSEYYRLFPLLKMHEDKFEDYLRMKINTFNYLLSKTEEKLIKNWCNFHKPIIPEERLVITIKFLASGSTYSDMAIRFMMGISTVSTLVKETMEVLWNELHPLHMPVPNKKQFLQIAEDYWARWNFPHCIGAIDGRHIRIKCPPNSGSKYFNYKRFHSIVLQALVDSNYKFVVIDVGGYGSQSDGGTFQSSKLYECLKNNTLLIPEDDQLPDSSATLPYFFVGDGAYPLMENLMKPYPGTSLSTQQRAFNKRLSRARMIVECTFGILCRKWGIFSTTIQQTPEVAELIVKCTCVLHNVIIELEKDTNNAANFTDDASQSILFPQVQVNEFVAGYGKEVRDELTKFVDKNPLNRS